MRPGAPRACRARSRAGRSAAAGPCCWAMNWPARSSRCCACPPRLAHCRWRRPCAARRRSCATAPAANARHLPRWTARRCSRPSSATSPPPRGCRRCRHGSRRRGWTRIRPGVSWTEWRGCWSTWPRAMCSRPTSRAAGAPDSTRRSTRRGCTRACARPIPRRSPDCMPARAGPSPAHRPNDWCRCAATWSRPAPSPAPARGCRATTTPSACANWSAIPRSAPST